MTRIAFKPRRQPEPRPQRWRTGGAAKPRNSGTRRSAARRPPSADTKPSGPSEDELETLVAYKLHNG